MTLEAQAHTGWSGLPVFFNAHNITFPKLISGRNFISRGFKGKNSFPSEL